MDKWGGGGLALVNAVMKHRVSQNVGDFLTSWELFPAQEGLCSMKIVSGVVSYLSKSNKVKCTLVQALRLCTGRTAHRGSGGIALPFHDHGTRRGWGVSVTPRPLFTPEKEPVPIVQEAGRGPRHGLDRCEKNLAPTGIRSPDRPARSQSLYRLRYPAHSKLSSLVNSGLGRLIAQVSISHAIRHTQPVGLLWTSDQLVAKPLHKQHITNTRDEHPYTLVRIRTRGRSNRAVAELRLRQQPPGSTVV